MNRPIPLQEGILLFLSLFLCLSARAACLLPAPHYWPSQIRRFAPVGTCCRTSAAMSKPHKTSLPHSTSTNPEAKTPKLLRPYCFDPKNGRMLTHRKINRIIFAGLRNDFFQYFAGLGFNLPDQERSLLTRQIQSESIPFPDIHQSTATFSPQSPNLVPGIRQPGLEVRNELQQLR